MKTAHLAAPRRRFYATHGRSGPWRCYFCRQPVFASDAIGGRTLAVHHVNCNSHDHAPGNLVASHWDCHLRYHNALRRPPELANANWLHWQYDALERSHRATGARLGCAANTVACAFVRHGIPSRPKELALLRVNASRQAKTS